MIAADKLDQVTRRANTVDDLAAEGRNYGDDYMAALETSAADVPDLVNTLRAAIAVHPRVVLAVHENGEEAWCPVCQTHYPCRTIRAIEEVLS